MILATIARDADVERFAYQVKGLRDLMNVRVVVAEGDSDDDTYDQLLATDFTVLKVEHGGPKFASVDNEQRWRQLASVCNVALTAAVRDLEPDEPLVYCEIDLRWTPETIARLVELTNRVPAVAPMSMRRGLFYDTWGYTKDGERFNPLYPYFPSFEHGRLHQIDTAGSCIAMSWTAAQVVHFSPHDCIRGIGRSLADHGLSLWLDPELEVRHP